MKRVDLGVCRTMVKNIPFAQNSGGNWNPIFGRINGYLYRPREGKDIATISELKNCISEANKKKQKKSYLLRWASMFHSAMKKLTNDRYWDRF